MNAVETSGIALIVAGSVGLACGGFSYTQQTHQAETARLRS